MSGNYNIRTPKPRSVQSALQNGGPSNNELRPDPDPSHGSGYLSSDA